MHTTPSPSSFQHQTFERDIMHYQTLTDKTSMIVGEIGGSQLVLSSAVNQNRNIKQTRKLLLILLIIQFILSFACLLFDIYPLVKDRGDSHRQGIRTLPPILFSIVYYAFGIFVTYRFYPRELRVFSWMGVFQYVCVCVTVFLDILWIAKHPSHDRAARIAFTIALIILTLFTFLIILTVITLKLAFKLIYLFKIFKREIAEQL